MNYLFIILFSLAFIFGQFARLQFDNGIVLLGIDIVAGLFGLFSIIKHINADKRLSSQLTLPIGLFVLLASTSLVMNFYRLSVSEVFISSLYILRFVAYAGLFFYIRDFGTYDRKKLKHALIGIIAAVVGIGFFQHIFYPNLRNLFYLGWDDHLYRLFSVFLDPNFTGALYALFFFYLLSYLHQFRRLSIVSKISLVILLLATFVSIFLTYSRTGLLMLLSGGIFYLLFTKRKKAVLFFIGLAALVFVFTIDTSVEGLNPFRIASTQARVESYRIALDIFSKHPVFGVGFNAYRYAQNEYGYRVGESWQTSHADAGTDNSFLFVLATTGTIGFLAFVYLWYSVLLFVLKKMKEGNEIAKVTFISFLSVFVGSFFINALFYPFIMAWLWMLVALTENEDRVR